VTRDLSVRTKLVVAQILVAAVVLFLYGLFHVLHDARVLRESIRTTLASTAELIGYNCKAAINFLDPVAARETLGSLKLETRVTHAWILDRQGRVFASYARGGDSTLPPPLLAGDAQALDGRFLSLARRIVQDDEVIGHVVVRYEMDDYRRVLMQNNLLAAGALGIGLVIAFGLALLTARTISIPVLRLVGTLEEVARKRDFSIRTGETRRDEIGALCRGFDGLLSQIQEHEGERDRADQALRESEEKYRTLVETANDGILLVQDGRLAYANRSLFGMFGASEEGVIGSSFSSWFVGSAAARRVGRKRPSGDGIESTYETVLRGRQPEPIHVEVNVAPIPYLGRDADLVIIRDISERKKAEAQIRALNEDLERRVAERTSELADANARLVELDQLKSMFLASMSHELRTPLNSIIGFTGLLLMRMSGELNDEQSRQLTMVETSANHLLNLINDILDISKIESGRVELALARFDLPELVREVAKSFEPLAGQKGLALEVEAPEALEIESDRRRVKQVLMNVAGNALKFTEVGGVRMVVPPPEGDCVAVRVSDTGIGIPPEDIPKLFRPFQQVDMSSTKRYEGTGLGLYLCRKILALLGGEIAAASEPGKGSRFTITLPRTRPEGGSE
jgi:PAS domain S-box-containing protein